MANSIIQKFTVVMAAYWGDDPEAFERAISSIYNNTVLPHELLIVFDGPVRPEIERAVAHFTSKYDVTTIRLERNVGLANALNEAIRHCKTEWIVRADADDVNVANRFENQMKHMHQEIDLFGSFIEERDKIGQFIAYRELPTSHEQIVKFAPYRNPFNHMTVCFRKSIFERVGGYPDVYLREDYALWASMIAAGARCFNISEPLVLATAGRDMYRRRGGLKYALGEVALQRHLVKTGLKGWIPAFAHGIARASIYLLGNSLRSKFYERFLRSGRQRTR